MINHITAKAGKKVGIENPNPRFKHINPHIFRHSIARYLKNKGFSVEWIQNFLGHASYKTMMDMKCSKRQKKGLKFFLFLKEAIKIVFIYHKV